MTDLQIPSEETIEVFAWIKLKKDYYEAIAGLIRVNGFKNFDEWVSVVLKQDLETMCEDLILGDVYHQKLYGKHSRRYENEIPSWHKKSGQGKPE